MPPVQATVAAERLMVVSAAKRYWLGVDYKRQVRVTPEWKKNIACAVERCQNTAAAMI